MAKIPLYFGGRWWGWARHEEERAALLLTHEHYRKYVLDDGKGRNVHAMRYLFSVRRCSVSKRAVGV